MNDIDNSIWFGMACIVIMAFLFIVTQFIISERKRKRMRDLGKVDIDWFTKLKKIEKKKDGKHGH